MTKQFIHVSIICQQMVRVRRMTRCRPHSLLTDKTPHVLTVRKERALRRRPPIPITPRTWARPPSIRKAKQTLTAIATKARTTVARTAVLRGHPTALTEATISENVRKKPERFSLERRSSNWNQLSTWNATSAVRSELDLPHLYVLPKHKSKSGSKIAEINGRGN